MVPTALLASLRKDVDAAIKKKPIQFVSLDPRILRKLLDEIDNCRVVQLKFERQELDPALRD